HVGVVSDFLFSSRRRHTSFSRDWSSDVCSSDLFARRGLGRNFSPRSGISPGKDLILARNFFPDLSGQNCATMIITWPGTCPQRQIGRASCRERGKSALSDDAVAERHREPGATPG